jgi:hypothetical protein
VFQGRVERNDTNAKKCLSKLISPIYIFESLRVDGLGRSIFLVAYL